MSQSAGQGEKVKSHKEALHVNRKKPPPELPLTRFVVNLRCQGGPHCSTEKTRKPLNGHTNTSLQHRENTYV